MDFKIDTFNLPYTFEIRGDVMMQSDTLFSVMQMTTEGNKYIIRRLKFEGPFVTDCLNIRSACAFLRSSRWRREDSGSQNNICFVYQMQTIGRFFV